MSRRRRHDAEELPFSLDSFLDIVANLVGILIRLIVMVGLGVRYLPSTADRLAAERAAAAAKDRQADAERQQEEWRQRKQSIEAHNAAAIAMKQEQAAKRQAELARRIQLLGDRQAEQQQLDQELDERRRAVAERVALLAEFARQAAALRGEVDAANAQRSDEASLLERRLAAHHDLKTREDDQKLTLEQLRQEVAREQAELDRERLRRQSLDEQLAELKAQIEALQKQPRAPAKPLVHFGVSLAKEVVGEELHYRCLGGRVANTHLHDLLDIMRREVLRLLEAKQPLGPGIVGSVGGFRLRYTAGQRAAGFGERTRAFGIDADRVELTGFQLEPPAGAVGELEADALAEDSTFFASLANRSPKTDTITLWVYPDSFRLAKAIEMKLHERGFGVALRPIPMGFPISGSPDGSASQVH